ncbi:uncharacterized protein (TIGR02231 family) [Streptomyces sp. TLI_235]|nr:DUF4139 domain-containing protein [Streptomyces sp. TLI_235]PBC77124.1 uncharacterized protein (TIGR02231 family) [Streptomyces sp. TLI_235]
MAAETAAADRWESVLDSVVVYASGALCRRRARGTVPTDGGVRLTGLPRVADAGSLRAAVLSGGARVTAARLEPEAEVRSRSDLPGLRRRVERAQDAAEALRQRSARQEARIAEVSAVRAVPPPLQADSPHRRTPADAWLQLADFVDERLAALHGRSAALAEELRLAEHELSLAEDALARASSAVAVGPVTLGCTAVVTLEGAPEGAEVELEVEYGVPGAVWVPTYRLTYRRGEDTGTLLLRAQLAQRTGEDWSGVRIGLSTADLQRRTDLPQLRSLRIGRRQPAPAPSGWREPPAGLGDLFTGYDAAGRPPQPRPSRGMRPMAGGGRPGRAARPGGGADATLAGGVPAAEVALPFAAPPPPPPPAPGAAPQAFPMPAPAAQAYGAAPQPPGAMPPPAPVASARMSRSRGMSGGGLRSASFAAHDEPVPEPLPEPVPAGPSPAQLDYAGLVLDGPDRPAHRRGLLFPGAVHDPSTTESRNLAESVAGLALPAHAVRPRVSAGSFDQRYDAAARADVPSDGTWHTVTVGEVPVSLSTEYVCVPAVEEAVYGTLVLANATASALLAGPVEVTVDGDFLLTAALPTLAAGAARRVGLGQAEAVRVARRTELKESTAGMLNSTTVLDHRIHVELANRLSHPVTVEVRERVPVSADQDVRIEERADWRGPDHPSEEFPASTRRWRVELPAGGTAELDGGYEIRIPAGKAIVGGNRRS